jgi:hypothetical protein
MKYKMREKDAIVLAGILGLAVFLLLFKVWSPLVWGSGTVINQTQEIASAGSISAAGIYAGAVSGSAVTDNSFAAQAVSASAVSIETRFAAPAGYERTEENEDSFASFVRSYPLKKEGSKVKLYNGELKANQDAHIAVFKLPIENEDLQQCADSVIRIYAEYFWKTKQYDRISFRLADGFQAVYTKWREGYRIQPGTTGTTWVNSGAAYDDSYANFKKYIRMVFAYAGTVSMKQESQKTTLKKLQVGDIFIQSGSPGHVVMVADICENAEGKKAFLLAQGYMPAQQFQLLKNPAHEDDPWYYEDEVTYPFQTPEYTFEKGSLRHLEY